MSTSTSVAPVPAAAVKQRRAERGGPGGAALGSDVSRDAKRLAAAILEVLAGTRTPTQAAGALGVSLPRYYHLESRALRGLLAACEPKPKGRVRRPENELAALRKQTERLERQLSRQQALVRLAQRTVGLAAAPAPPSAKTKGKRRRRPAARALRVAERLQPTAEPEEVMERRGVSPPVTNLSITT